MINIIVPIVVAIAFAISIVFVWVVKPGSKLWRMNDAGYDKDRPPSQRKWHSSQIGYTILLVFLGSLCTVLAWISLNP